MAAQHSAKCTNRVVEKERKKWGGTRNPTAKPRRSKSRGGDSIALEVEVEKTGRQRQRGSREGGGGGEEGNRFVLETDFHDL